MMSPSYFGRVAASVAVIAAVNVAGAPPGFAARDVTLQHSLTDVAEVWVEPADGSDLDGLVAGIERHLVVKNGVQRFDVDAAISGGESALVVQAGRDYNSVVDANSHMTDVRRMTTSASFPVWGNWCGPGHSGPGAPKDTLDTLCMRHDKCYISRGYFDCFCDAQMKAEIRRFSSRMGGRERAMAAAITVYFSVTPCKP